MIDARLAEILASLATAGDATSWPAQLVRDCVAATQMTGVGLTVMGTDFPATLAAAGRHAQRMQDLQFTLGEGPSAEAARSGRPVLVPALTTDAARRWPAFTPRATDAGVGAVFAFPLQVGAIAIGVLDLYRTTPGGLSDPELRQALVFADSAVAVLLHLQDRAGPGGSADQTGALPTDHPGGEAPHARLEIARAMETQAVVHQATGMISVQLGGSLAGAMSRLRAHAYLSDRSILDVAADVVARRLTFDHSEPGTTSLPPGRRPHTTGNEESP